MERCASAGAREPVARFAPEWSGAALLKRDPRWSRKRVPGRRRARPFPSAVLPGGPVSAECARTGRVRWKGPRGRRANSSAEPSRGYPEARSRHCRACLALRRGHRCRRCEWRRGRYSNGSRCAARTRSRWCRPLSRHTRSTPRNPCSRRSCGLRARAGRSSKSIAAELEWRSAKHPGSGRTGPPRIRRKRLRAAGWRRSARLRRRMGRRAGDGDSGSASEAGRCARSRSRAACGWKSRPAKSASGGDPGCPPQSCVPA